MYVTFTGFRYDDLVTSHSAAVAKLEHSQVIFQVLQIMGISLMYYIMYVRIFMDTQLHTHEQMNTLMLIMKHSSNTASSCIQVNI